MPARQHRTAMVERVLSSTHASCPVTPSCAHALGAKTAMARLSPYRTTKSIRGLRPLHLGRAASAAPLGSGSDYSIDALVTPTKPKPQMSEFAKRCVSGALLGAACSVAVISGGTPFVAMMVLLVVQVSKEYWGFVSAKEMAKGLPASSNWVAMACSAVCAGMVVSTYLQGRPQVWLAGKSPCDLSAPKHSVCVSSPV